MENARDSCESREAVELHVEIHTIRKTPWKRSVDTCVREEWQTGNNWGSRWILCTLPWFVSPVRIEIVPTNWKPNTVWSYISMSFTKSKSRLNVLKRSSESISWENNWQSNERRKHRIHLLIVWELINSRAQSQKILQIQRKMHRCTKCPVKFIRGESLRDHSAVKQ